MNEAASPQIRNMATLGGNLCQRPRCWYFRNGLGLLPKDEAGKDLVDAGDNRYHAILGNDGPAKFVSPSTIVPVLIAYGAKIRLEGPKGKRELPLEKFFVIPKTEKEREHDLKPNEIVTEVVLPPRRRLEGGALRNSPEGGIRLAARAGGGGAENGRLQCGARACRAWVCCAHAVAFSGSGSRPEGQPANNETRKRLPKLRCAMPSRSATMNTKCNWRRWR